MTKYVQLPPVVDAMQWDGTLDGAQVIRGFLSGFRSRLVTVNVAVEYGPSDDGQPYTTLKIEQEGRMPDMRPNWWVIVQENGDFEIVREDDFPRFYGIKEG